MFNNILVYPILNLLVWLYGVFGNLGLAILSLTLVIRGLLLPIMLPSMKISSKQKELAPEIAKLKERYKGNNLELAKAQTALLQKNGVYPALGCIPQIVSLIVLIALYRGLNMVLGLTPESVADFNQNLYSSSLYLSPDSLINTRFLYLDLTAKDPYFVLPVMAAISQFLLSKMIMPAVDRAKDRAIATPGKADDLAQTMQQQGLYLMPLMTLFLGFKMPSGLILYWFLTTVFSFIQYRVYLKGWGGLNPWLDKLRKVFLAR